jgi:hypothetical protein
MSVLRRLNTQAHARGKRTAHPHWYGFVSELPLIAEFCVRNGATNAFFGALDRIATSPACIVLLMHLADMIRLNFTIFSDSEYDQRSASLPTASSRIAERLNISLSKDL